MNYRYGNYVLEIKIGLIIFYIESIGDFYMSKCLMLRGLYFSILVGLRYCFFE